MTTRQWLEALSYLVTIVGLPFAIWVFIKEQRKERGSAYYRAIVLLNRLDRSIASLASGSIRIAKSGLDTFRKEVCGRRRFAAPARARSQLRRFWPLTPWRRIETTTAATGKAAS